MIVYRAVGKYPREGPAILDRRAGPSAHPVGDGRRSLKRIFAEVSLADAQAMRAELNPDLLLGGVAIPERHSRRETEPLRLIAKQEAGCRFFVTQIVTT